MRALFGRLFVTLALLAPACGGSSSSATPAAPSNLLSVAGTYTTRVAVIAERNTCGAVTVQDNPTTVTHTAGASELSMSHAGSTYRGTVDSRGQFVTPPASFPFPDADYTIGITGQFTASGFTATVELTKRAGSMTCTYAVGWTGTKQGSPNTIPG